MAAKTRRDSVYVMYEGYREGYFLEHLAGYSNVRFNPQPCNGGTANQIVTNGIKHSARDVNVYVFFDEDFQSKPGYAISDEALEGLENAWKINDTLKGCSYRDLQKKNEVFRNPILVVSYPQSIEGFLLRLLGKPLQDLEGKTTQELKQMIAGYFGNIPLNDEDNEKIQGYDKKIDKYSDEIAKLQKSESENRKHRQFLEAKIKEHERNKNKVQFIRFLSEKLPLPVIAAKRADIPEADILLRAFGL